MNPKPKQVLPDAAPSKSDSAPFHLALHVLAGGVLVAGGALTVWVWDLPPELRRLPWIAVAAGVGIGVWGRLLRSGRLARISDSACLLLLSVVFIVAALEGACRLFGMDFAHEEEHWRKSPPYYRQPVTPTGKVFFRRSGPEEWTGQVLNTHLRQLRLAPNPYGNEPVVTVKYDALGFRNEEGLKDWDIVVAGDSFVELGYLSYPQLFTTIAGRQLSKHVLNLGVSYTGPLAQLSNLENYGVAPGTRQSVLVFFEGNDLDDLAEEIFLLKREQETGGRTYRPFRKHPSFLRALFKLGQSSLRKPPRLVTAHFSSAQESIAVSFLYTPPNQAEIPVEIQRALEDAYARYARFGREHQIETWIAFMPCKERVLHGLAEFAPDAPVRFRDWKPTDLPQYIGELAAKNGIRFVDLTPSLTGETHRTKELLYNSIYDTHVNARGSAVVGAELARQLAAPSLPPKIK